MKRSRRAGVWVGAIASGMALAILGVLLLRAGLDNADKWASVIGMFVALAGLGVSIQGVVLARRATQATAIEQPDERREDSHAGTQIVSQSWIAGDNIQIGQARDVDIRREH